MILVQTAAPLVKKPEESDLEQEVDSVADQMKTQVTQEKALRDE